MAIFSTLLNRAQASVDTAIDHVVNRIIVAVPFLLSTAFSIAAAAYWLNEHYGPITTNLILAGGSAFVGLVALALLRTRSTQAPSAASMADNVSEAFRSQADEEKPSHIADADRELIAAALTSAAPIAVPVLIRAVLRNLPIVLAIIAAIFVMAQSGNATEETSKSAPD